MLTIFELFSRLFILELPRKKFECIATKDKLFAINTSKNTLTALLFTLFSSGLLFTGVIQVFVYKIEITNDFILAFFLVHPLIGLIGLRHFLWLINGREELNIENNELTLQKKGTFFTKTYKYNLALVTNIRPEANEDNLSSYDKTQRNMSLFRKMLFIQTFGQIYFDYNNKTIKIFNDMTVRERAELIAEITKLQNKTGH